MIDTLQNLLRDFSEVFEQRGGFKSQPVSFTLNLTVAPIQMKPHHVAFLDLLNLYHSFLKDKAAVAEPLHCLLD